MPKFHDAERVQEKRDTGAVEAKVIGTRSIPMWIDIAPCGAKQKGKVTSLATFGSSTPKTRLQMSEGYDWIVAVSKQLTTTLQNFDINTTGS